MPDSDRKPEQKLARLFDRKAARIVLALAGLPASLFIVVFGLLGIIMGIDSIMSATEVAHSSSLIATILLGMLGACGAWLRIIHRSTELTTRTAAAVRALLTCGIGSAGVIAVDAALRLGDGRMATAFVLLAGFGAAMCLATPRKPGPIRRTPVQGHT